MATAYDLDRSRGLTIQCRGRSGASLELEVLDISLAGCLVERRAWSANTGDRVLVKLPGLAYQSAEVVWVEDNQAGVAFEELLYEPVLEHLRQSIT